ncbi:O-succinylbenzoic acid--CoA ligase [Alkalibacillus filiformis]|uniref:2-succinylbenzoate--CoA ligase n=1 Tax=Alkalibacillus filiformis TaxID=200990 RepID=A0ABU0DX36_9BACI|nr:o-succinylbenzoate--CoA ligase [Alkalibacillus filiformis]MDQ0352940.1 O-succinylbenzoic acid--CoA ligase [Alkalibacillus filiformis]
MTEMINWLTKRAELSPNKQAVVLKDGTAYTFSDLKNHAKSVASYLAHLGIKQGDHVALLSKNSYDFLVTIHALNYLEVTSFLINTRLTAQEINYQLEDGEVRYLIYDEDLSDLAEPIAQQAVKTVSMQQCPKSNQTNNIMTDDLNLKSTSHILYTSGTTGNPKGVQLTYQNHWWSATASALNLGLHDHDRWLLSLPMFHVGGLSIVYRSVIYGIPIHLHDTFDVEAVHEDLMKNGVTIVSVVSVMLEQLLDRLGEEHYPEQFRCMLLGGGPAPKGLLQQAKDKHVPVFQTYGMTETASQFCTLDDENALSKIGSAGKPLFPNQLKIIQNEQEQPANEVGEIVVKGPTVTQGYYNRDEATRETIVNGWLKTGDLGYFDEDGFLYVVDRRKDLIISGGENVYPAEIEGVLKMHPKVKDAGVVGQEDDRWGQVPAAFIVFEEAVDFAKLEQFCLEHLAKYKCPKKWTSIDELPRNASKKLLRHQLQKQLKE